MVKINIKLICLSAIATTFFYAAGGDEDATEGLDPSSEKVIFAQLFALFDTLGKSQRFYIKTEKIIKNLEAEIDKGRTKMCDTEENHELCAELARNTLNLIKIQDSLDLVKQDIEFSERLLLKLKESLKEVPENTFFHSGDNEFFAKFEFIPKTLRFEFSDGKKIEFILGRPYLFAKTAPAKIEFLGHCVRPGSSGKDLADFYFTLLQNGSNYNVETLAPREYKLTVPSSPSIG